MNKLSCIIFQHLNLYENIAQVRIAFKIMLSGHRKTIALDYILI